MFAFAGAMAAVNIVLPHHPLLVIALGDFVATLVIFFISVILNNSSMYDPYWSVKPAVIAWYYFFLIQALRGPGDSRCLAISLYAVRLTSNFYRDWAGLSKEDFRYVRFRKLFPACILACQFPRCSFFPDADGIFGCLPLYAIYQGNGVPLNGFDFAGIFIIISVL